MCKIHFPLTLHVYVVCARTVVTGSCQFFSAAEGCDMISMSAISPLTDGDEMFAIQVTAATAAAPPSTMTTPPSFCPQ